MLAFRLDQTARHVGPEEIDERSPVLLSARVAGTAGKPPLLRLPPFPGALPVTFARPAPSAPARMPDADVDSIVDELRSLKVGGTYWGSQPRLPQADYVLVRIADDTERARRVADLGDAAMVAAADCDPWHLIAGASRVIVDSDDELALVAAMAGVPIECAGEGRFASLAGTPPESALRDAFREHVLAFAYFDPFTGEPISFAEAARLCGFWRGLIDGNRDIGGAVGFAFWKRGTVAPLLWRGADWVPFLSHVRQVRKGERIALWRARTPARVLAELEARGAELIEVEDGFIRSAGLGADCVPPLSIVVDRLGAHFDPGRPSELERLLQDGEFDSDLLDRARRLRALIVASGVSKYAAARLQLERRDPGRRHILVPGQVEDDRAVVSGGAGLTSNLELLRRVRAAAPDAWLIYKPHPDVEAGHRKGAIPDELCLSVADEVVRDSPISALLDLADEVHVNTSLAGFEALMRGKPVTTYGVPFYAGWGLTCDLGPVPARRSAKRTLDELVAAVLLVYPRYLDPMTGLPCPAEVLVRRLSDPTATPRDGAVVRLRRLQGLCRRGLAALRLQR